jgi:hypothetical protein
MKWPLCLAAPLLAGLVLAVLPGCGSSSGNAIKITGKVLRNGQPLRVSKDTYVTVVFTPDEKTGTTCPARFIYDGGTYEVLLPPGKYRARCTIQEKNQQVVASSPEMTKIVHDLTSPKEVDLEVGQ